MQDLTTLERTKYFLQKSSVFIIFSMVTLFLTTFLFFSNFYYKYLLTDFFENDFFRFVIGTIAAFAIQLLRFSFGIVGSYDFERGNKRGAYWGIGLSGSITFFEIMESLFACKNIGYDNWESLALFILPIIIFSYLAEIRLIMSFQKQIANEIKKEDNIEAAQQTRGGEKRELVKRVSMEMEKELKRKPLLREIKARTGISISTI
jgi:hypothetical protein